MESTVNHWHYDSDGTTIWVLVSIEIQGLCFYVWFVRQIIDSKGTLLRFLNIMQNMCISKSDCSKINPTNQFDYASAKNGYRRDLKWLLGCFNGQFKIIGAKTHFCVKFLLWLVRLTFSVACFNMVGFTYVLLCVLLFLYYLVSVKLRVMYHGFYSTELWEFSTISTVNWLIAEILFKLFFV